MEVRFTRDVVTVSNTYRQGQVLNTPDPVPPHVVAWLNRGVVVPVRVAVERAVVAPEPQKRKRGRPRKHPLPDEAPVEPLRSLADIEHAEVNH